jgi:hypothetical protein
VGVFAVGPSATLGRFSGVKGRLVSLRRAVDREKGLILLGDAFPVLPAADVKDPWRGVSTFSCARVSSYSRSIGEPSDAAASFVVLPKGLPCCDLLAVDVCVIFEQAVAGVAGPRLTSAGSVGA